MKRGISTNLNMSQQADCLKNLGLDFVLRYYSSTTQQPQKRLTPAEAQAISAAGLEIGIVYEDNPVSVDYFSENRGIQDGNSAYNYAIELNQPENSAIYFAVDYDAKSVDISGVIVDYFKGVETGMKLAGTGQFKIAVYGSGAVCEYLKKNCQFVKYTWLAMSTGWLGSKTYSDWDISQAAAPAKICKLESNQYEENQARNDFGSFTV